MSGTYGKSPSYTVRAPGSVGGYVANIGDLAGFQVFWNQWEVFKQSMYDSAAYPAAGISNLNFFALPVGQGTGFGGSTKTLSDTNMVLAGQMPANQMFLISQINVELQVTTPTVAVQMPAVFGAEAVAALVNDAYIVERSGNLILTIGSKPYLTEAPLMQLPPQSRFEVQGALADVTTAGANLQSRVVYGGARGDPYVLTPNNLLLISSANFGVTLNWPEGLQAITNPARIFVRLMGVQYRKAQ